MDSFVGDNQCKIDAKGRIVFPSSFKKQMPNVSGQDRFVLKKDIYEKCLILYTWTEWEHQNELIRKKLNPYNKEHSRFLRAFYKGTAELILDNNNRLLLPKRLLDQIEVDKVVYLSGQDKKIEIWAKELYENNVPDEAEFAQLAENILGNIELEK